MNVQGERHIPAAVADVWEIINDPKAMQVCMPGCTALEIQGEDRFEATLEIGVGAMTGAFQAELCLSAKQPPIAYRLDVSATGAPGEVHGGGTVTLEPDGGETRLRYDAELRVTGLMALGGDWLLPTVAGHLAEAFLDRLCDLASRRGGTQAAD